ncbi:hypothetical protein Tco_0450236 [Tanacetum coccineum]
MYTLFRETDATTCSQNIKHSAFSVDVLKIEKLSGIRIEKKVITPSQTTALKPAAKDAPQLKDDACTIGKAGRTWEKGTVLVYLAELPEEEEASWLCPVFSGTKYVITKDRDFRIERKLN